MYIFCYVPLLRHTRALKWAAIGAAQSVCPKTGVCLKREGLKVGHRLYDHLHCAELWPRTPHNMIWLDYHGY